MKNAFKFSGLLCFVAILLSSTSSVFSAPAQREALTPCSSPTVSVTGQTANSISFAWDAVPEAIGYKVWYVRTSDNTTSQQYSTGNNYFSYSGLASGTYQFYFVTECAAGSSASIVIEVMI
jgi:hypothetical protein